MNLSCQAILRGSTHVRRYLAPIIRCNYLFFVIFPWINLKIINNEAMELPGTSPLSTISTKSAPLLLALRLISLYERPPDWLQTFYRNYKTISDLCLIEIALIIHHSVSLIYFIFTINLWTLCVYVYVVTDVLRKNTQLIARNGRQKRISGISAKLFLRGCTDSNFQN